MVKQCNAHELCQKRAVHATRADARTGGRHHGHSTMVTATFFLCRLCVCITCHSQTNGLRIVAACRCVYPSAAISVFLVSCSFCLRHEERKLCTADPIADNACRVQFAGNVLEPFSLRTLCRRHNARLSEGKYRRKNPSQNRAALEYHSIHCARCHFVANKRVGTRSNVIKPKNDALRQQTRVQSKSSTHIDNIGAAASDQVPLIKVAACS